ncbi:hypothetical protein N9L68_02110 [bacterium]|nr:hypothetical protein [bacterium]
MTVSQCFELLVGDGQAVGEYMPATLNPGLGRRHAVVEHDPLTDPILTTSSSDAISSSSFDKTRLAMRSSIAS